MQLVLQGTMINNLSFHVQIACSDNGLFSLTMTLLLAAAEESSKLLTANQGATHRYTTIGTASRSLPLR